MRFVFHHTDDHNHNNHYNHYNHYNHTTTTVDYNNIN